MDLSVAIITFNEESNLKRCLASLPPDVEIIVVDSLSTDKTIEVAESFGARVFSHEFSNFAAQKNLALSYASRRWILSIDADEALSPDLSRSIKHIIGEDDSDCSGYRMRRRLHFLGREMRFGKTSDAPLRLFKRGLGEFEGVIHEGLALRGGKVGRIKEGALIHFSYANLEDYFKRFNRYTTLIAQNHYSRGKASNFLAHMVRPWFEFIGRYFLRLGFLDGYPGYVYALNSSLYAFIKYSKLLELRESKK